LIVQGEAATRKRDAAATKAALLESAVARFARDGYDRVTLREIAADAGVDVALVSRYFGGKDELFTEVLNSCGAPQDLFVGDPAEFGQRVARMLVDDEQEAGKLDVILVMLRSCSSPKAAESIRKSSEERFYGPFARWLGGPAAAERARLAGGLIKGVALDRRIADDFNLSPRQRDRYRAKLAKLLQAAVDP
jgi:AcrR family transcriptional regulator